MRRTLLAVGFAVLASMLLAPHDEGWDFLPWYNNWHWFPAFWVTYKNPILLAPFMGQTVFVAVLAAMIVNIRWRRRVNAEKPRAQVQPREEKPLHARDWLSPAGMFTATLICRSRTDDALCACAYRPAAIKTAVRMTIKRFILPAVLFTISSAMTWAGCKSDCRGEYDSEVESCKSMYDDPDDADELQTCIQSAKDQYESCMEECDN